MADNEKLQPRKENINNPPKSPETQASSKDLADMAKSLREGLKAEIDTKKSTLDALQELKSKGVVSENTPAEAIAQEKKVESEIQEMEQLEEQLINPSYIYTPDDSIYPTASLKRTDELLNTNLEKPLQDIEGFTKGLVLDSGKSIVKLAKDFITDLIYLPRDIARRNNS